ncbi:MAG: hypothetical protein WC789_10285 [Lentisphaeria bacterium]
MKKLIAIMAFWGLSVCNADDCVLTIQGKTFSVKIDNQVKDFKFFTNADICNFTKKLFDKYYRTRFELSRFDENCNVIFFMRMETAAIRGKIDLKNDTVEIDSNSFALLDASMLYYKKYEMVYSAKIKYNSDGDDIGKINLDEVELISMAIEGKKSAVLTCDRYWGCGEIEINNRQYPLKLAKLKFNDGERTKNLILFFTGKKWALYAPKLKRYWEEKLQYADWDRAGFFEPK